MSINPMNDANYMMDLIAKKQNAIGENLANIDTPGYKRRDVDFNQYLGPNMDSLETKLTSKFGASQISETMTNEEINPAHELLQLQKNSLLYSMATRQMSSVITQMKTAINVGK